MPSSFSLSYHAHVTTVWMIFAFMMIALLAHTSLALAKKPVKLSGPLQRNFLFSGSLFQLAVSRPYDQINGAVRHSSNQEHTSQTVVSQNGSHSSAISSSELTTAQKLQLKYKGKLVHFSSSKYPNCDIYLCGTMHVSKSSAEMVQDVVRELKPDVVMLELCPNRIDSIVATLDAPSEKLSLGEVIHATWQDKSLMTLGSGLLTWMQIKAAKLMGNKLGSELSVAAREAHRTGSHIVLGDRYYDVTIQRIFDRLRFFEKVKAAVVIFWEAITMSFSMIRDYMMRMEDDVRLVQDEIVKFSKYFPAMAAVVIHERDEYLAQSLIEIARIGFQRDPSKNPTEEPTRGKILAVVGSGHLVGIRNYLEIGGASSARMMEISSSSKHSSTWPGDRLLHIVDGNALFGSKI